MASFDGDDEEEVILFQCGSCNVILATTLQSDGANADLGIVSLEDVPDTVTIGSKSKTSRAEGETGCIYSPLSCSGCESVVGKYYIKTTEELSDLQDHACLLLDQLSFYTVPLKNSKLNRSTSQDSKSFEKEKFRHHGDHDILAEMKSDIHKIQYVMCSFDERIRRIEQLLKLPELKEEITKRFADPVRQGENSLSSRNSSKMEDDYVRTDSNRSGDPSTHGQTYQISEGDSDSDNLPESQQLSLTESHMSKGTAANKTFSKSNSKKHMLPKQRLHKRKNVESEMEIAGKKQRTNMNEEQYL